MDLRDGVLMIIVLASVFPLGRSLEKTGGPDRRLKAEDENEDGDEASFSKRL
jgi:hypothetical protein